MKIIIKAIITSILFLIGLYIINLPLHEFGHWLSSNIMGVSGYIELEWHNMSGVFYNTENYTSMLQQNIVCLSGGFFVAIIFLTVSLFKFAVKIRPLLYVISFINLGYAFTEINNEYYTIFIGALIGFILGMLNMNNLINAYLPKKEVVYE